MRTLALASAGFLLLGALARVDGSARQLSPTLRDDQPSFRAEAELVVLHVTVKDRRGAYVTGLSQDAFTILDAGQPQPVSVFSAEDSPVTVGLIIDSSGSMHEGRADVLAAARSFATASHPQDDLFALTFNDDVSPVLGDDTVFTNDPDVLDSALQRAIRAYGRTALYDAVARGLDYVERGHHPRRVLIVVADGADNASRTTFDEVLRRAQASNAAIYTIGIIDPLERDSDRGRLRELATATGGEAFFPHGVREVASVLGHIALEIRHTYTLGFVPTDAHRDGAFRQLRVLVHAPGDKSITVRTRRGYRAGLTTDGGR
jgi:VWFA-related protein